MHTTPAILFVCLGNICRSPLAEAAFRQAADAAGVAAEADSAGTAAYHIGNPPDYRSIATAKRHGIDIEHYQARQVSEPDYTHFTHIFALDSDNLADLQRTAPAGSTATIALLMDYVPGREGESIADPYYGDEAGFEDSWADAHLAAQHLVALFQKKNGKA